MDGIDVPSEPELMAITLVLQIANDCAFSDTTQWPLVLTTDNEETVARIIEDLLKPLARDIGTGPELRARLSFLTGKKISVF